jgi:hypothetical protein
MFARPRSVPTSVARAAQPVRVTPRLVRQAGFALGLLVALSCGGSPSGPAPVPQVNQPPVISSIAIEPDRIEVNGEVSVQAHVQDAETPVENLIYEWEADGGTFSGEGASVTWRAPEDAETPADYALRLTIREVYGTPDAAGVRPEHRVTASSPAVRVHDSPRELREMALRFLHDFADSGVSADECVREFSDSCRGKESEREDIEENREHFRILSSSLDFDRVDIASDGMSAEMTVECEFRSRIRKCPDDEMGCVEGSIEEVEGDCDLTAIYEDRRWWLCDSSFRGSMMPIMRLFFGRR